MFNPPKCMFMKAPLIAGLMALAFSARAQYTSPTAPETVYANLNAGTKIWNVGTDTRAEFAGPYGSTTVWFANFLNVTVSDHKSGSTPRFHWNGTHMPLTIGSHALPEDAYDPDVVLIENNTRIMALIVYYSASAGGYCMTYTRFVTTATPPVFEPLAAPLLLEPYTMPLDSMICINIDADNDGNYAVAYQVHGQTYCKTGSITAGTMPVPTPPSNTTVYSDHIQPDVSIQHSNVVPAMKVKVSGLRTNRSGWKIAMRPFGAGTGPSVTSAAYPAYSLHNPRIASPLNNTDQCSLVLMRNNPGSSAYQILFNAYAGTTPISSKILNAGASGFPPSIAGYVNRYPAISYAGDYISVAWHTSYLPGPPAAQNNTFVGLDLADGSFMPTTPGEYQDITPGPDYSPVSTIAVSGRYTVWGKSAAYEIVDVDPQPVGKLVWTIQNSGLPHWKPTGIGDAATLTGLTVSPNPATDVLILERAQATGKYSYAIFDMQGRKVLDGSLSKGREAIGVKQLPAGVYTLRVSGAGAVHESSARFVKQ